MQIPLSGGANQHKGIDEPGQSAAPVPATSRIDPQEDIS